jgi:hypothetical protein
VDAVNGDDATGTAGRQDLPFLTLEEALERWENKEGLASVYGSTKFVDAFNLKFEVYEKSQDAEKYLNPSFTKAYAASLKSE